MVAVGIDVGGTFTDFVWIEDGLLRASKVSTSHPQGEAVLRGLRNLGLGWERIVHGITLATNAILEGRWARTALLVTAGFRDLLEIGRQNRPSLYDLFCERPAPLSPENCASLCPKGLILRGGSSAPWTRRPCGISPGN